ncbi:MAG TPA: TIGR03936 family radical SAM-associated protein [Chthonomonadales bacterium]|nr:TIGR03936 family radical SAM-associated protein [Chthonomonadales bacterium]
MAVWFEFEKGEGARWLGHLDILRVFERAIRRAHLPVAYSEGFNPRIRIAFVSALGVGVTGSREPAFLQMAQPADAGAVLEALNAVLPGGVRLVDAECVDVVEARRRARSCIWSDFRVVCDFPSPVEDAVGAARSVMAAPSAPYRRQRKGQVVDVDLRPWIGALEVAPAGAGRVEAFMRLALLQEGATRPSEVIDLLAERAPGLMMRRAHRVALVTQESAGEAPIRAQPSES